MSKIPAPLSLQYFPLKLGRVIARYADDAEVIELARALEGVSASILARRYCPGLNAASYDVFRRYGMKGGAQ